MRITLEFALAWSARLTCLSLLICSLEYLCNRRVLRDDGLMSWELGRVRAAYFFSGWFGSVFDPINRYPRVLLWIALRAVLCASILLGAESWAIAALPCLSVFLLNIVIDLRSRYGHDGSDQISSMILLAIGVSGLVASPVGRIACVIFIAFQACLAYGTAGWAKAPLVGWRDGSYISAVLKTKIYGTPALGSFLERTPALSKAATLSVLAWECTFPAAPFLPAPAAYGMILLGVLFHISNAAFMGLNAFLWSFVATYPPLVWVVQNRGY